MKHFHWLTCVVLVTGLCGCPKPGGGGGVPDAGSNRCEIDLAASGYFAMSGTGSSAKVIDSASQLIGGELATGRMGDVLLQNDKVRVVIEQPGRSVGPLLSGGGIIDADLQRAAGEPGHDGFGRMSLFYAFGRLSSIKQVEVLSDGSNGGPAVVASTGVDVQHDLLNLQSVLENQAGLTVQFVVDPSKPLPVRSTTYYVLSPGENRVRMLTAFCNDGDSPVLMPLIELMDVGAFEIFNPGPCNNALGNADLDPNNDCTVARSKWFGTQADGVAYGMRSQSLNDLTVPTDKNAVIGYGGVVGVFIEGESLTGLLTWTNPDARTRPGVFNVRGKGQRSYLRDFYVERDLANIAGALQQQDAQAMGMLSVQASLPDGSPAANARITVIDSNGKMVGLLDADAQGHASSPQAAGTYTVSAALLGHLVGPTASVTVTAGQTAQATAQVLAARKLGVTIKDGAGAPMPGKFTVYCSPKPCPFGPDTYAQHFRIDGPSFGAATIDFVGMSGQSSVTLPPGEYDVVVSRGPEFSTWPDTWPTSGFHVDLRTADATVNATLGRIIDTPKWVSADLHVHAVNSTDSAVGNALRAANFLAEGVDVLLSTDHEWITDFAPVVRDLGAEGVMATMIGEEVTTFTHGHFNTFPIVRDPSFPNGGAFDHAGGEDAPTLRMPQVFSGIKEKWPGAVVQLNHPRGGSGVLTNLKVDTATLATHGLPDAFNMAAAPDATAMDTKLFGDGFDLIETANGATPQIAVLNDWMTFLSRGTVRTTSGVSDTHKSYKDEGGYARTYAQVPNDAITQFLPAQFADAIRTQRAFVTNGPVLAFSAQKLDGQGNPVGSPVGIGETLSITPGQTVEFTLDVQGLEWMPLDRVELYSHAPGRESVNGESNVDWPDGRIFAKVDLDPTMLPLEAVPGAQNLRRVHVVQKFTATPMADTWFAGMARAINGRNLQPLHGSRPWAWTNAILIDADGSGKYDDFPLKAGQPLTVQPPERGPRQPIVPTERQMLEAISKIINHAHE